MHIFMLLPSLLPGLCTGWAQLSVPAGLATRSVPRAGLPVQQELHLAPAGLLCQVMLQALPPSLAPGPLCCQGPIETTNLQH